MEPTRYRTELGAALKFTMQAREELTARSETLRCYLKVYRDQRGEETFQLLRSLSERAANGQDLYSVVRPITYLSSLRTRLIVAYTGLILLGFGMLTVLAGSQLSSAVRSDYEDRLVSETNLVAEGVRQYLTNHTSGTIAQVDIDAALATYRSQIEGTVSFSAERNTAYRSRSPVSPELSP